MKESLIVLVFIGLSYLAYKIWRKQHLSSSTKPQINWAIGPVKTKEKKNG